MCSPSQGQIQLNIFILNVPKHNRVDEVLRVLTVINKCVWCIISYEYNASFNYVYGVF